MQKAFLGFVLVLALSFGASQPADAAGFGVYGSFASGSGDWSYDNAPGFDVDTTHTGAGFVFDSAVARDQLFNYRINIGYDKFSLDESGGDSLDLSGLMISNVFGFGTAASPGLRVWMGPEIRLLWPSGSRTGFDYDLFGLGFGPTLGLNFNLPGRMTIGIQAGYQMLNYTGEANGTASSYDVDVKERMFYVNIAFLFRSRGDR